MTGISAVFVAQRTKLQDAIAKVACVVWRAYPLGGRAVITTPSKEMLERLGSYNIVMAFEVMDQMQAVREVARALLDYEIDTESHLDLEFGSMFGRTSCLTSPELDGVVICFFGHKTNA